MINTSKNARFLSFAFLAAFIILSGTFSEANAQRDPFEKPAWARTKDPRIGFAGSGKPGDPVNFDAPGIDQRINYYKRLREDAVANSMPIPKVTSVLTLNELAVTGIFKTPRGYAAMVEATPLKLSYTIYPGDKFFDGQLVAVEENRLVFRKVTKVSNGKFVSSVENKSLRKYTERDMIQGTAPAGSEMADQKPKAPTTDGVEVKVPPVVSPLTEMEKLPTKDSSSDAAKKAPAKKPVKVAKKGK